MPHFAPLIGLKEKIIGLGSRAFAEYYVSLNAHTRLQMYERERIEIEYCY